MLLALLVGVPCQRLAPTAGKWEAEVSGGAEVEAAQPLVVEHSCLLLLQPLPAHPHKAQTQSPAHRQSLTFIPPILTATYLPLQLDQEVLQQETLGWSNLDLYSESSWETFNSCFSAVSKFDC